MKRVENSGKNGILSVSDNEVAPRVLAHPGTRPTESEVTVDERILAQRAQHSPTNEEHEGGEEERRSCFYCLEGWVFLGSLDHDGEEVIDSVRCRRCDGTGEFLMNLHHGSLRAAPHEVDGW